MSLFSDRTYAVALAAIGTYGLFHLDWLSAVLVGVPTIYLALHPFFKRSREERAWDKRFEELNTQMSQHLARLHYAATRHERILDQLALVEPTDKEVQVGR